MFLVRPVAELSHKFSPKQELAKYISKNITATKNVFRMGGMMIPYVEFMANLRNTFKIHVPNLKWFPIFIYYLFDVYYT